jgi:hypothetical protein
MRILSIDLNALSFFIFVFKLNKRLLKWLIKYALFCFVTKVFRRTADRSLRMTQRIRLYRVLEFCLDKTSSSLGSFYMCICERQSVWYRWLLCFKEAQFQSSCYCVSQHHIWNQRSRWSYQNTSEEPLDSRCSYCLLQTQYSYKRNYFSRRGLANELSYQRRFSELNQNHILNPFFLVSC